MADPRSIHAVSEAVVELLRSSYRPEDFDNELEFRVFTPRDFADPMANGVSLFLYRIFPHGTSRTPAGRLLPNGRRRQTQLPLECHFLLTVWAREASLQHQVAGWLMRTVEDHSILPASLLNTRVPGSFRPDETVEIALGDLRTEDLFRLWEALDTSVYQLSIPYLARVIYVESSQELLSPFGPAVTERTQAAGVLEANP